jgi:hypothetical protein
LPPQLSEPEFTQELTQPSLLNQLNLMLKSSLNTREDLNHALMELTKLLLTSMLTLKLNSML